MDFITPLATILGSGLVVALVTHFMTSSRLEKEVKRQKLEGVYKKAVKFQNSLFKLFILFLIFHQMKEKISLKIILKMIPTAVEDCEGVAQDLIFTCGIYFPRLAPRMMKVLGKERTFSARGFGGVINAAKKVDFQGKADLQANAEALRDEFDEFYQEILNEAARINSPILSRIWAQRPAIRLSEYRTKIDFGIKTEDSTN